MFAAQFLELGCEAVLVGHLTLLLRGQALPQGAPWVQTCCSGCFPLRHTDEGSRADAGTPVCVCHSLSASRDGRKASSPSTLVPPSREQLPQRSALGVTQGPPHGPHLASAGAVLTDVSPSSGVVDTGKPALGMRRGFCRLQRQSAPAREGVRGGAAATAWLHSQEIMGNPSCSFSFVLLVSLGNCGPGYRGLCDMLQSPGI